MREPAPIGCFGKKQRVGMCRFTEERGIPRPGNPCSVGFPQRRRRVEPIEGPCELGTIRPGVVGPTARPRLIPRLLGQEVDHLGKIRELREMSQLP